MHALKPLAPLPSVVVYTLWNGAIHAICWVFILAWTTFFGLLRDDAPRESFYVWGVGAAAFLVSARIMYKRFQTKPDLTRVLIHCMLFYGAALVCTLCAGVPRCAPPLGLC
jgi:hypothetical protein